jgi:hypothetical protein
MPTVRATLVLTINVDHLPPEIPGYKSPDGDETPISGAEQVVYDVMKTLQEVVPDSAYLFVRATTVDN